MRKPVLWAMLALVASVDAANGDEPAAKRERPSLPVGSIPENELGKDTKGNKVRISDYHGKVVIVSFWASWCGPCKMAAPEVAKAAANLAGRAIVLKVDTEAHGDLAQRYNVRSIPNFALFRDGKLAWQQPGLLNHRQLEQAALGGS